MIKQVFEDVWTNVTNWTHRQITMIEVLGRHIGMLLPAQFRADYSRNVDQYAESGRLNLRSTTPPHMDESNSIWAAPHRNSDTC
jgi:hypothetical protein